VFILSEKPLQDPTRLSSDVKFPEKINFTDACGRFGHFPLGRERGFRDPQILGGTCQNLHHMRPSSDCLEAI
jgi:hypothetical protein